MLQTWNRVKTVIKPRKSQNLTNAGVAHKKFPSYIRDIKPQSNKSGISKANSAWDMNSPTLRIGRETTNIYSNYRFIQLVCNLS